MGKKERQFEQSSEWLDWLSDNTAESPAEPPKKPVNPAYSNFRAYTPHQSTPILASPVTRRREDDAVVINFHLPELRLPAVPWRRVLKISLVVVLVGGAIVATPYIIKAVGGKGSTSTNTGSSTTKQQPAYAPLEPTTSSAATSHVQNVEYDSAKQLYKYNDTYEGVSLTVSQQPLPDDLRNNPDKLKALAASIGANEAVTTTNGTVYISTDANLTTQRLVFASKQILVFMQANGVLKNPEWVKYVQALQSKV